MITVRPSFPGACFATCLLLAKHFTTHDHLAVVVYPLPWLTAWHQHELVEELDVALITTYSSSLEELERHLARDSLKCLLCLAQCFARCLLLPRHAFVTVPRTRFGVAPEPSKVIESRIGNQEEPVAEPPRSGDADGVRPFGFCSLKSKTTRSGRQRERAAGPRRNPRPGFFERNRGHSAFTEVLDSPSSPSSLALEPKDAAGRSQGVAGTKKRDCRSS